MHSKEFFQNRCWGACFVLYWNMLMGCGISLRPAHPFGLGESIVPIDGVDQPQIIGIDSGLRLRKLEEDFDFALAWYQDAGTVWLVDGDRTPYTMERLCRMYAYLAQRGEVYFIEVRENGAFRPIGDVAFCQADMPIVIGEQIYRGRGIGGKVIGALVERGRALGYRELFVREVYAYNTASRACFENGFESFG